MGVDHGGFDVFVPEAFLEGADVAAVLEEVGGEGVAESVRGDRFVYFCLLRGFADGFLQDAGVKVAALLFDLTPNPSPRGRGGQRADRRCWST